MLVLYQALPSLRAKNRPRRALCRGHSLPNLQSPTRFSRLFDSRRCRFSFMKPHHPGRRPADARGWYRRRVLPRARNPGCMAAIGIAVALLLSPLGSAEQVVQRGRRDLGTSPCSGMGGARWPGRRLLQREIVRVGRFVVGHGSIGCVVAQTTHHHQ